MKTSPIRSALIILVALISMVMVLPNFFDDETVAGWPDFLPDQKIVLGLDLQGGSHLLLQVNREDIISQRIGDIRREARAILIGQGIGSVITTQGATLTVELTDPAQLAEARAAIEPLAAPIEMKCPTTGCKSS
jgi:SecD/SecF fusion protein